MRDNFPGFMVILVILAVVLLIGAVRKKAEWIMTFLFRAVVGTLVIYFVNMALTSYSIPIAIGINPVTVLTAGVLGIPGIAALYGINLLYLL